jgi:hypothetical protein
VRDVLLAAIEKGRDCGDSKAAGRAIRGQNGPVAIWLLAPSPKSIAGSRFFVLYRKTAWKSATQERAAFWAAITSMENAS